MRVSIVTGATKGIGRAVCESLVAEGVRVSLVGRNAEGLERLARALGGEVHPYAGDVSQRRFVKSVVKDSVKRFGPITAQTPTAISGATGIICLKRRIQR